MNRVRDSFDVQRFYIAIVGQPCRKNTQQPQIQRQRSGEFQELARARLLCVNDRNMVFVNQYWRTL